MSVIHEMIDPGSKEGAGMKAEIFLPEDYSPAEDEAFMNERQLEYFRRKLLVWKADLMDDNKHTIEGLAGHYPKYC